MKNQLFILALLFMTLIACEQPASTDAASANTEEADAPDNATFEKRANLIRAFLQAHCDENIETQIAMLADSMRWSPPSYNGNEWLGKDEFVGALRAYHETFDNIQFTEGIATADTLAAGMWAGSVYSAGTPGGGPNGIRQYGTWTATHAETGKEIGLKWYALTFFDEDDKIISLSDYFDTASLVPADE